MEINEFLKMPLLVSHFIEHQKETPNLKLWDFLCMHYAHGEVKDADFDRDMKLPFKSHDTCNIMIVSFCNPIQTYTLYNKVFLVDFKKTTFNYNFSLHSFFLSSIWQPPKFS
jgi:hypothetical protein